MQIPKNEIKTQNCYKKHPDPQMGFLHPEEWDHCLPMKFKKVLYFVLRRVESMFT